MHALSDVVAIPAASITLTQPAPRALQPATLAPPVPMPSLARAPRRLGDKPACARCGGTGYVYLWSVASVGTRVWFCDRHACKCFWSEGATADQAAVTSVTNGKK